MLSDDQLHVLADALLFGLLAEPFFHVGTDALMSREFPKAAVSYAIGSIPALAGLIVLGILSVGPFTAPAIVEWIHPVASNPYCWLSIWLIVLLWSGGPAFVKKMRGAWQAKHQAPVASAAPREETSPENLSALRAIATAFDARPVGQEPPPREEINFNYLPDPPTKHGWTQGYPSNPIPADATWKAATDVPGGMSMALSDDGCAIDYSVRGGTVLAKRIVCEFKFVNEAMIFARVKLATRDKTSRTEEGFIKFEFRGGPPRWVPRYHEWELPIDPPPLGNGWHHLDIDLVDAVNRTWGQDGWCLRELVKIRLRGKLSISPIKLY